MEKMDKELTTKTGAYKLVKNTQNQTNLKLVVFTCVKSPDMSCFYYRLFFVRKCQILIDNLSTSTKFALVTPLACYCLIPPIKWSDLTFLTIDWLLLIFEVQRKVEWVLSKSFRRTQLGHSYRWLRKSVSSNTENTWDV